MITTVLTVSLTAGMASAATPQVTGIDVSRWQHNPSINWASTKADGIDFAFIKATEGAGYTNPYFVADRSATQTVNMYRGAYHFARPDSSSGDAAGEARYFVRVAGNHQNVGDLPPVLDLESAGGLGVTALRNWVATWLTTVKTATGRTPIIYVSPAFWEQYMGNSTAFHDYPLWIAHYGVSAPRVPGGWPTWTFWQGTSTARVSGIIGDVDRNTFNGNLAQLKKFANIKTPATPATPVLTPDTAPILTPKPNPVTKAPTKATLHAMKTKVRKATRVRLYGHLTTTGTALAGKTLQIYQKRPGTRRWHRVSKSTSIPPTGWYQASVAPRRTMIYKATYAGDAHLTNDTSNTVKITVRR